MKYLGIYIKDRKMYFLLTAFICGVTAVINYLYSAPLQAGLYAKLVFFTDSLPYSQKLETKNCIAFHRFVNPF